MNTEIIRTLYVYIYQINIPHSFGYTLRVFLFHFSFDVRGNGVEIGRHWNDGINLGARARFDENSKPEPVLWIESLRDSDQGTYRCRVDFKQAPTKNFKINLNVIGKTIIFDTIVYFYFTLYSRLESICREMKGYFSKY